MNKPVSWGTFDPQFIDDLVRWIDGRRVLEVFAGNGLLAKLLSEKGVEIKATTLLSGHDGHNEGMYFDVEKIDAVGAVQVYGESSDILLMSWPVASEAATHAALRWGDEKPIVFIGEVTNHDLGFAGLGGCASDVFFDLTNEGKVFNSYNPRNMLERAAVRFVDPQYALRIDSSYKSSSAAHSMTPKV